MGESDGFKRKNSRELRNAHGTLFDKSDQAGGQPVHRMDQAKTFLPILKNPKIQYNPIKLA
jgi:hypothetical protein